MPNDEHGDARNITMRDLEMAAETQNMSAGDVVRNISEAYQDMGGQEPVGSGVRSRGSEGHRGGTAPEALGESSGTKAAENIERIARESGRAAAEGRDDYRGGGAG
jgi:hypothetical protein